MKRVRVLSLLAAFALWGASSVQASTIFLAGTDAASFHRDADFVDPVFKQLQDGSSKNVLVVNNFGAGAGFYATSVGITYVSAAGFAAATLSDYSAVFFASPGTCCSDPAALLGARGGDVAAYVAGGGGLYVEDYQGLAAWDPILGIAPGSGASSVTAGAPFATCIDPGVSTAAGIAFGFKPSYTEGCFVHQMYDPTFWASKGFFALQVSGAAGSGGHVGDFVTMASGFIEPGKVPEPASLLLLGSGIAGLVARRRRQKKNA